MGNVSNFGLFLRCCAHLSDNPLWWWCQFSLGRWVLGGVTGRLQDIPLCWGDFDVDVGWSPSSTEVQPDPAYVNTLPILLPSGCSQRSVSMAPKPPPYAQPSHGLLFLRQQLRNSVSRPFPWRHWHSSGLGDGGTRHLSLRQSWNQPSPALRQELSAQGTACDMTRKSKNYIHWSAVGRLVSDYSYPGTDIEVNCVLFEGCIDS